jgi:cysteine-rich repeat protein
MASGGSGTGGDPATGGSKATGGVPPTGGAAATGGSSTNGTATDYSGLWSGLTTQGKLASFRVYAAAVTQFTIDWILPKVSDTCSPAGDTTTTFGAPAPIAANATFTKGPVSANPTSLLFSGQFNSSTTASGTVGVSYSVTGCSSSSTISWTAQKVICGDGIMQWPETCDPGTAVPTSTCSAQCQLFPVSETERNDNIGLANGPYTDDTLVSASISTSDDVDVFAVRNLLAGSVSIEFETHGETVGTCTNSDTFMQVARSDGTIIAADDDGSRMLYCSYAMVSVAAGETIYVAVSSSILQPIPRYQLHIKFPHS